ncbi:MAG: hypothetical protein V7L23_28125 [Nostoc sp.]|uniref:hypothetical protein n=1 Tax=Nostoc sp. TaxID=1180 RepID=UPI002FEF9B86
MKPLLNKQLTHHYLRITAQNYSQQEEIYLTMTHSYLSRFRWILIFMFWLSPLEAKAQQTQHYSYKQYSYKFVSFSQVKLPPEYTFFTPAWITDRGKVYGSLSDNSATGNPHIAVYQKGTFTVLQPGFAGPTNNSGTVGGSVSGDGINVLLQAALFKKNNVEIIPLQPGYNFSFIWSLNDPGTALVESDDTDGKPTYTLYRNSTSTQLNFGPTIPRPNFLAFIGEGKFINNQGVIAGTNASNVNSYTPGTTGFRFDTKTGQALLLQPLPTDTLAWGLGINNRGEVLGYSFVATNPYHENIGVWDKKGVFHTYFYETISSNALVFNDNDLIVITLVEGQNISYLIPQPGVRLNIADLVTNLPAGQDLQNIFCINNNGSMIGVDSKGSYFLLKRINTNSLDDDSLDQS